MTEKFGNQYPYSSNTVLKYKDIPNMMGGWSFPPKKTGLKAKTWLSSGELFLS